MKLKRIIPFVLSILLFSGIAVNAQTGVLRTEKAYKAHASGWLVDVDEAYALAKKTGKPIMANFTGSDWCGWCKKLKYEVFDKPEFKAWAAKNVVLLEVDFPRRFKLPVKYQQQNAGLQKTFQITGYPTIWVFNLGKKEGNYTIEALGKTGYVAGGPKKFEAGIDQMIKKNKDGKS